MSDLSSSRTRPAAMTRVCAAILVLACAWGQCSAATARPRRAIAQTIVLSPLNTTLGGVHPAYWFRRLFGTELSPQEEQCARNGTVLPPARARDCRWLFEQSGCSARQWLVLGEGGRGAGALAPTCRPRPCAPGFQFLADERRCVAEQEACAGDKRRAFRYSLKGEGRCHCKGFFAQAPDGSCQKLYHRGTCPPGEMLAPAFDATLESARGACVRNPCEEGALRVEGADGRLGACAPLGSLDCSLNIAPLLAADAGLYVPVCVDSKRNVITVHSRPSRGTCPVTDNRGQCVATVVRSKQPFDWSLEDDGEDSVVFPASSEKR